MTAAELARALEGHRLPFWSERVFHDGVEGVLQALGVGYEREHRLPAGDRLDFLVAPGIAVELKIKGGLAEVTRQLHRYASEPTVSEIVLVTTRLQLAQVPRSLNGKPVHVSTLLGGL